MTFYTHRVRVKKEVQSSFNSKIPFVNRVMNDYYRSLSEPEYFENKLYLTVCYKPFNAEDKVSHFLSRNKRNKNIFDEPINDMNEICGRLDTYLSRFTLAVLVCLKKIARYFLTNFPFFSICYPGSFKR